ncbi:MAG TPA: lasso peptide biosynthesis B2 protein [Pyrinomonadaceae bacterium]|nr:lasso peptide biosynthesis B2 protein [Pyrinomonadaceae bacterium]
MGNGLTKTNRLVLRAGRKFVSQPREAWLLCRMAWWVVVLSVAARLSSLPRALKIVAGPENRNPIAIDAATQERFARSIDLLLSADVWVFKPICWKRAAVLHRYLAQTRIIFGVRNDDSGKVTGHAWLESEGRPILETTPPEYITTYSFPSSDPIKKGEASSPLPFIGPT